MDRVLQPLMQRFKLVDSLLQGFDAPLVPRSRRLGSRVRGPPTASQLNDAAEDRHATHRPPAWIAGTRHCRNLPPPLSRKPREGRRKQDPRRGSLPSLVSKDYSSAHVLGHRRGKLVLIPD